MNIAFIPVRGGSKSIPLKNIQILNGKPLVYWTAKAASDAICIDKVIIATDSREIRRAVQKMNLPKIEIYMRDAENAQDTSSTESVMLEYIGKNEFKEDDNFFLIQATSPLLRAEHIYEMFLKYKNSDYDSMFTAVREKQFHWIETENGVEPINYDYKNRPRRQEFQGILAENGACYVNKIGNILKDKCRLSGKIGTYEMPAETAYEIDEEDDFLIIEDIMQKKGGERINIAFGVSNDWLKYTSVAIASILDHAKYNDNYYFYILSNGFSDKDKALFLRLNNIKKAKYHFLEIDDKEFDGAINDWLGVSASYRLKLPSLVKEDKILYLDSDITVMQDIAELYHYDIADYYVAAVEDKCGPGMNCRIGLSPKETFFNSGVQLINLKAYRENNLEKIMIEKMRASDIYTDQDVLNIVCKNKILPLPLKYNITLPLDFLNENFVSRREEAKEAEKYPFIIHHVAKPWHSPNRPCNRTWTNYRKRIENITE